jgi:hypothetical protein
MCCGDRLLAEGGFPPKRSPGRTHERAGRLLRSRFERRGQADYDLTPVRPDDADRAIEDAEVVVDLIASWLAEN